MIRRGVLEWVGLAALWLVLAATLSRWDILAAAVAASLVVSFAGVIRRRHLQSVRLDPRWLVHLLTLPTQVLRDLGVLARHLVHRRQTGVFRALAFDVGGDDPRAVGRRALLTAGASLGPNTYVIGWEQERQVVLVHQLERSPHVLPVPGGTYE